jgi:hypothetical protein
MLGIEIVAESDVDEIAERCGRSLKQLEAYLLKA